MYRVEKSKDYNRSGEALSILNLKRLRLFITSTTPVKSLGNQLLSQGTSTSLSLDTQKVIDHRKHSFEERTQPLRNINQGSRAKCIDKSRFNWIFKKFPNHTKKWETRATLNTFKIMSLTKREMKFQNIRLGTIGDHICTNMKIKLKKNINFFTNKHKFFTIFIHVSNDKGPLENL
jgi:hypothetical protein